jgi:Tol biopolymer transport system component/imidazolonepropionase-like amidohydrolase
MRILPLAAAGLALTVQTPEPVTSVTVSQGTSMAVAVSPDGRRLAIDLQGSLWTLPREGGAATRITDDLHDARQPAWSPDGRRIAFQSYRNGTWDIWTIAPDGSGAAAVTSGPDDDREPHWSPDGTRIAFSSDRSGSIDIWALDVATGAVRPVTQHDGNEFWPAWSPDGSEIAFVATGREAPGLYAATVTGTERRLVGSAATLGAAAWTSGSTDLVYSALADGATRLVRGERELSADEDVFPFRPSWVPAGPSRAPSLLYTADGHIKERPNGGADAPRVIPFRAELPVVRASYTPRPRDFDSTKPAPVLGIVRPSLSPDGERLAFAALGDVWTARRGEAPKRLTDDAHVDTEPAWSPDGRQLAYSSDREGSMDIWIRDLTSGTDRRLTTASAAEMWPVWSPDGQRLAFVTIISAAAGQLSIVDVATGETRRLLDTSTGPISPGWAADGRTVFASILRPHSSRFREGLNQAVAIPATGGAPRYITVTPGVSGGKRGEGPAWSPDGRHLATIIDGQLHLVSLTPAGEPAGPPRLLAAGSADQVSWTSDSRRVVFSRNERVMVARVDTGGVEEWPVGLSYVRAIPDETYVIHAGRLVDGVAPTARENMDVVVSRHRIVRVVPHAEGEHRGPVVDASKLTVMPGLMEAHGHFGAEYGERFARLHLAYGITSVRSPGGHPYASVAEREAVASGRRPGPRLFLTGYLLDGSRVYYPMATAAPTAEAVDREIERARLLQYDFLKTYVRLPDALQRRAIAGAHAAGIPVSSHEVYPSARSGIDSVEHFSATSRRGYSPKLSLLNRVYDDVVQIVAASGMTLTPTLALSRAAAAIRGSQALRNDPRWMLQPAWVRAPFDDATPAGRGAIGQRAETLMAYHRAGVPLLAGTDSPLVPYAIALHLELEAYVSAGLTPFEALQTATINVARALRVDKDLGSVEPGKLADLAIVEGDPLTDIRTARNLRMVVVNGVVQRLE